MSDNSTESYARIVDNVIIPDVGLGDFLSVYTPEKPSIRWTGLYLVPVAGQYLLIKRLVGLLWFLTHRRRFINYEHGYIKQKINRKGRIKKEYIIDYHHPTGFFAWFFGRKTMS